MPNPNTPLTLNQKLAQLLASKPVILQLLKFAAIGTVNTALDFIILNYLTKSLGITAGVTLGLINVIGFSAATIQSYIWNRAWTFSSSVVSPLSNAVRLMMVGGLGFLSFVIVVLGGIQGASETFYLFVLIVFLVLEILIWYGFGLTMSGGKGDTNNIGQQFGIFVMISIVGGLINSAIVAGASYALAPGLIGLINADTVKNVAKIMATAVSLVWNFVGYKLVVFKK